VKGDKPTAPRGLSVALRTARGRSAASQRWLARQLNDPYVAAAKQQGVPAFVVMHDSALDEVCRKRPGSIAELLSISGFGEYKAALYGPRIFEALEQFRNGARATPLDGTETPPRPAKRASGL